MVKYHDYDPVDNSRTTVLPFAIIVLFFPCLRMMPFEPIMIILLCYEVMPQRSSCGLLLPSVVLRHLVEHGTWGCVVGENV